VVHVRYFTSYGGIVSYLSLARFPLFGVSSGEFFLRGPLFIGAFFLHLIFGGAALLPAFQAPLRCFFVFNV
jgi:hypothetical protein